MIELNSVELEAVMGGDPDYATIGVTVALASVATLAGIAVAATPVGWVAIAAIGAMGIGGDSLAAWAFW